MQEYYGNHMTIGSPINDNPDPDIILCEHCNEITTDEFPTKDGHICFNCMVDTDIEIIN